MDSRFIDLLKQDVAKWEEAAKAVDELLSHVPEPDRLRWKEHAANYRQNAKAMRELLGQITDAAIGA